MWRRRSQLASRIPPLSCLFPGPHSTSGSLAPRSSSMDLLQMFKLYLGQFLWQLQVYISEDSCPLAFCFRVIKTRGRESIWSVIFALEKITVKLTIPPAVWSPPHCCCYYFLILTLSDSCSTTIDSCWACLFCQQITPDKSGRSSIIGGGEVFVGWWSAKRP